MNIAHHTIDLKAAFLYIEHKAPARAMLRVRNIIAIHRLAMTDITTTSHKSHSSSLLCYISIMRVLTNQARLRRAWSFCLPLILPGAFDILQSVIGR